MRRIAVVLSGCGNKDGAEIQESVSLIIALNQLGVRPKYFAPDIEFQAKNFLTNEPLGEKRNVLLESARITRSQISDLKSLKAADFDGIAFPGGYGVALNLCNWAAAGAKCQVHPEVERVINEFYKEHLPIAAICIAPALIARVLGKHGVTLTVGNDKDTAAEIAKTGAEHVDCPVDDYVTDRGHKIITTPAYMFDDATPDQIFKGISGLTKELVEMA